MVKLNLTPTIITSRKDKHGKCAVKIRSCIKRKIRYYSTGINVLPEQWEGREIIKHPNKALLNTAIRSQLAEIEKCYIEGKLFINKTKLEGFYKYCTRKIEEQREIDAQGTWKHKMSYMRKLQSFAPSLTFDSLTPSFMNEYETHCKKLGNKPTTVWGAIKFIRIMINSALRDKVIAEDPLKEYVRKPYVNPVRTYLTDEDIDTIEKFSQTCKIESLVNVANWFLFACYSGLRYSDVKAFNKECISNGRIMLRTAKGRADVSIKVHPRLKSVLDRINSQVISNQKMNNYLKIVAERCEIKKDINFHLARHTFAIYFLNHGGSMETLQALLGHHSLRTTAIYGKITNIRLDAEIDKVFA